MKYEELPPVAKKEFSAAWKALESFADKKPGRYACHCVRVDGRWMRSSDGRRILIVALKDDVLADGFYDAGKGAKLLSAGLPPTLMPAEEAQASPFPPTDSVLATFNSEYLIAEHSPVVAAIDPAFMVDLGKAAAELGRVSGAALPKVFARVPREGAVFGARACLAFEIAVGREAAILDTVVAYVMPISCVRAGVRAMPVVPFTDAEDGDEDAS